VLATFSIIGYFYRQDPELLERRMRLKEKERRQQLFMKVSVPFFFIAYLLPGFDRRYGWSDVPFAVVVLGDVVVAASYCLFALVLRENRYASRVIEVAPGQHVVTTGPYAIVRHPMYVATTLLNLFSPLALGSYVALAVAVFLPLFLVMRIRNVEEVLKRELNGYSDYIQKIRYRLIPGIW
jgi:protein-S-isoprenylcysteine O-methyltransferase Ste14